ncbi:protein TBATA [Neoarius graeffei]|uniref:protein TBATA n=1 Tax=Neoarius graeffei TaxID=443677 RepID=UPI00298BCC7E|nr:protein TBATA [Neoarius graeffei]
MELSEGQERDDQEALKSKSPASFMSDLKKLSPRVSTSSSARFGALSHHSFFSRHNPHPNRVRHISGLNGSPVCIVNDDWYSNTPLFPHPLIRGPVSSGAKHTPTSLPYNITYTRADGAKQGEALISEAWREELKDLATKVNLSAAAPSKHKIIKEEEPIRRKTQYSSETGRIIPPTSWRTKCRDFHTANARPGTYRPQASHIQPGTISLEGQELRVLELLCQILQTDSLSLVQQWLLLAGDQEKELVLGMLQQATCDSSARHQQPQFPITAQSEPQLQTRRKRRMMSVCSTGATEKEKAVKEKPELIGDAEVLRVQTDESENFDSAS